MLAVVTGVQAQPKPNLSGLTYPELPRRARWGGHEIFQVTTNSKIVALSSSNAVLSQTALENLKKWVEGTADMEVVYYFEVVRPEIRLRRTSKNKLRGDCVEPANTATTSEHSMKVENGRTFVTINVSAPADCLKWHRGLPKGQFRLLDVNLQTYHGRVTIVRVSDDQKSLFLGIDEKQVGKRELKRKLNSAFSDLSEKLLFIRASHPNMPGTLALMQLAEDCCDITTFQLLPP